MTSYNEIWRPVLGFEGKYDVSNHGRVRSKKRHHYFGVAHWSVRGKIRKLGFNGRGYLFLSLWKNSKPYPRAIHRLVLESFVGPRPKGMTACHYDGVRTNNYLTNLRWDTLKANFSDRDRHGTTARGVRHGMNKLTETQVRKIKRSKPGVLIASDFGVSKTVLSHIRKGKIWKHIHV